MMEKVILFIAFAIGGYLIAGINPAIIFSKAIYHKDIRECGSKNPGFTNFKRSFGTKWAIVVMVLDLLKAAVPTLAAGIVFNNLYGHWDLGVTFTCVFAMLGHAYPVWYKFKGGKGFLVCLSAMWILDWRIGLIATAIMVVLLLTTKYMSLSTMVAMISCPIVLAIIGTRTYISIILCSLSVLFMIYRHKTNIVRLFKGTESKFSFGKKKKENKEKITETENESEEAK
jgi:glycerol-3-phosphate acyltransferase PlsY